MKHLTKTAVCLLTFCAVWFAACDDGGSDSITSVDSSKKVEDLSGEELQQLCEDYTDALVKAVSQEFFCTMGAIAASAELGGSELACDIAYDTCIDMEFELDIEEFFSCDDFIGDSDDVGDCDATVGEVDTCVQDLLKTFEDIADSISCADNSSDDLEDILDFENPASCEALGDDCLDLDDIDIPL
jgi:hypothetical protein